MNIKDSCRYQNVLTNIITTLQYYISNESNVVKIIEKHYKSKANKEAQDEEVIKIVEKQYDAPVEKIVKLINSLITEKLIVSKAIEDAKRQTFIEWKESGKQLTLDTAIEYNKNIHSYVNILKNLVDVKSTETKTTATDYKFNVEGNQTSYKYPVDVIKTIDYDRNIVRDLYKSILTKADIISTKIDEVMLMDIVKHDPLYNIHDSIEEILANTQ